MRKSLALSRVSMFAVLIAGASIGHSRTLHSERSLYRNILVSEDDGKICLHFSLRRAEHSQSCRWTKDPRAMVFPYTRMMFASLLVHPVPQRILMVGLGGGTIPVTLHELLPSSSIDIVEIDSAVQRVAERFFDFRTALNMRVTISDARVFIKRALKGNKHYDLILLDAFNGDYIPEHLLTREFLTECKTLLTPGGVLAANTFSSSKLYAHESVTYRAVFGEFLNLRTPASLNRIIVASNGPLPSQQTLAQRAQQLKVPMQPYQIEIDQYPAQLSRTADWDEHARVLTDQFSPANLLNSQ